MDVILQSLPTAEARTVRSAAMLMDAGAVNIIPCVYEDLAQHVDRLKAGGMPVGSVEFIREAMKIAGIEEPASLSYPSGSQPLLGRTVSMMPIAEVLGRSDPIFIKPMTIKAFTGFVYRPGVAETKLDEHDQEQLEAVRRLDPGSMVYASNVVAFEGEWRYYVQGGIAIGYGRYDPDGPDDAQEPSEAVVAQFIDSLDIGHPHAIDIGVLADGRHVLVEANDGFSIGLYGRALTPKAYLEFLRARWNSLQNPSRPAPKTPRLY